MVRIYATGMGPLPWENPRLIHGSCCRTWQLLRPILEAGHEVCLTAIRVFDHSAPPDLPQVQKLQRDNLTYFLVDELSKFAYPEFHQEIIDQFQPEVILGITTPACGPLGAIRSNAPMWIDVHGYVMGEAQILAEERNENGFLYLFWKRYDGVMHRADCFSTTSNIQRHTLIGELGALGRLNRHTVGYEFVYSIPIGRADEEVKKTGTLIRGKVVPQDAFILLWLGGYNHWSDPETLFRGIDGAMKRNPRIHFVSTGGRIDGVSEGSFDRLLKLVSQSEHKGRYHFQGWVNAAEIPNYLLEADAGVNVDRTCYEAVYGARHRITEMLRAGLPVLTTRITEISRELERAGAGICFPTETPELLTAAILEAVDHPSQLMEMGVRGRQLFLEKGTDEITAAPLLEWLQDPIHAPDHGKDKPWRENLLYERLQNRSLWQVIQDHLRERKARKKSEK